MEKFRLDDLREMVLCVEETEVRSAKTEVCGYLKNKIISINQVNYKVPENRHATEGLVVYIKK